MRLENQQESEILDLVSVISLRRVASVGSPSSTKAEPMTGPPSYAGHYLWASLAIFIFVSCVDAFLPSSPIVDPPHNRREYHCPPLLGIRGFRNWFETTFPSAVVVLDDLYDRGAGDSRNGPRRRQSGAKGNYNNRPTVQPETFDHVLIDANQFLHSNLRKAYNRKAKTDKEGPTASGLNDDMTEYSLLLLFKEINRITTTTAIPRKSLVIAVDGSPGAAKLDMQRTRRSSVYKKAESQERQIDILRENGWRDNDFGFINSRYGNSIFLKHERERLSLNISPGTAFMDKVTDALLYYSWQYICRFPRVRVYLSPSSVHGEGEVKLLDWITFGHEQSLSSKRSYRTNVKRNETIAIIGGDSDLVLMGLVVPPSIAKNIYVLLPGGGKSKSLVVSVWETTRVMTRMIEGTARYGNMKAKQPRGGSKKKKQTLTQGQINQARIDMALLIIMNGNDYLPKIRGCRAGFDSFFEAYLNLVRTWLEKGLDPFLITFDENNKLCFNVPFALAFFQAMSSDIQMPTFTTDRSKDGSPARGTELGTLLNLVEANILPKPARFKTISPKESSFQRELWEMNSKIKENTTRVIDEVFADGAEIVRLTLGDFPTDASTLLTSVDGHGVISRMSQRKDTGNKVGGRSYLFEVPHRQESSVKSAKYRLACLALEEIFGKDNLDVLFGGSDGDENDLEEKPQGLAEADAASYLGGLLWNLETYERGCCADYGYDYGRRASPSPFELVDFLQSMKQQGRLKISCDDLIPRSNTAPLSDGLACLAAAPPQAYHIVPEPWKQLVDDSSCTDFEDLYNSCFHNETFAFDIQSFEEKCTAELSKIVLQKNVSKTLATEGHETDMAEPKGRRIIAGNNSWTILSYTHHPLAHPFEPPTPFTDRVRRLRRNSRIRASKLPVKSSLRNNTEADKSEDFASTKETGNTRTIHSVQ